MEKKILEYNLSEEETYLTLHLYSRKTVSGLLLKIYEDFIVLTDNTLDICEEDDVFVIPIKEIELFEIGINNYIYF